MRRLVLAILVALSAWACGDPGPVLRMPTDVTAGYALSNSPYGKPRSVGSISLCISSPGTATITRVALHQPTGDIRVEAFAVRPNPFARGFDGLGTDSRPLDEIGAGFEPGGVQQVSEVCPTIEEQANDATAFLPLRELGVQVSWSSGDITGGAGLEVTYQIAGVERTAEIPVGIWLCARTCPDDLGL